jgi:hypothetical protein
VVHLGFLGDARIEARAELFVEPERERGALLVAQANLKRIAREPLILHPTNTRAFMPTDTEADEKFQTIHRQQREQPAPRLSTSS